MEQLKEVVSQTLEKRGVLAKMRVLCLGTMECAHTVCPQAQLRAHVIQAVDEEDLSSGGPGISRGQVAPYTGPEGQPSQHER